MRAKTVEELRVQFENVSGHDIRQQVLWEEGYSHHLESLVLSMFDEEDLREAIYYVVERMEWPRTVMHQMLEELIDEWLATKRKEKGI